MRTLVITFDNDSLLSGYRACLPNDVDMINIFKRVSKTMRIVRGVLSRIGIMPRFFLESWVESLSSYSTIIIMDSSKTASCLYKTLRRLGYSGRICYYYWNTVEGDKKAANPTKIDRDECEIWSFDPLECQKFNLCFNPSFYSSAFIAEAKKSSISNRERHPRAFFMGLDKGRLAKISQIKDALDEAGVETMFYVVRDETSDVVASDGFCYSDPVPYSDNLSKIASSDILVEVTKPNQSGVTIRTLEALYFGKKLLTDNQSIRDLNLYNDNNVYIVDSDFPNGLTDFITAPYSKPSKEILEYYSFESWIGRFAD